MSDPSLPPPFSNSPPHRPLLDVSYRAKLMISMCGVVFLTGLVIIALADRRLRKNTQAFVHSLFKETSSHAVTRTKDFVQRAAPVAQSLQLLADQGLALDDLDRLARQLLAFVKANPGLTAVLYGDEAGNFATLFRMNDGRLHVKRTHLVNGLTHLTEYEVMDDGSWKIVRHDNNAGYDPRNRPFYLLAKEKRRLAWTGPYMFFTQGVPGISCVVPALRPTGELRGVFSVDFDLIALSQFVGSLSISENSRVFLFTPTQELLAHPALQNLKAEGVNGNGKLLTLADTGDPLVEAFRRHLQPQYLGGAATDEFHFFQFQHDGQDYLASTTVFPIGDGQPWVVGAIAPQADFLQEVARTRWLALSVGSLALCLAALLAAALARRISRPVQSMIGFMGRVGDGDLKTPADFSGSSEFRRLSAALNRMIAELRERLQLRHSLSLAMEVQKSLLPAADPVSPRLDIAGRTHYCDQTGGDYYDFIDIARTSESSLLVAVGDVTGHGIAAALLMATARGALHCRVIDQPSLGALMTRINHVLARNNRHHRFMTLLLLEIDARTSSVNWSSAGHDPAIIFDPKNGRFRELDGADIPLGLEENVEYEDFTSPPLPAGSILVIGTDGVWEMFDNLEQQYGKDRLREVIRVNHASSAAQIASALEKDLAAFRGIRSPDDDVTFVIVKFLEDPATGQPAPLSALQAAVA